MSLDEETTLMLQHEFEREDLIISILIGFLFLALIVLVAAAIVVVFLDRKSVV